MRRLFASESGTTNYDAGDQNAHTCPTATITTSTCNDDTVAVSHYLPVNHHHHRHFEHGFDRTTYDTTPTEELILSMATHNTTAEEREPTSPMTGNPRLQNIRNHIQESSSSSVSGLPYYSNTRIHEESSNLVNDTLRRYARAILSNNKSDADHISGQATTLNNLASDIADILNDVKLNTLALTLEEYKQMLVITLMFPNHNFANVIHAILLDYEATNVMKIDVDAKLMMLLNFHLHNNTIFAAKVAEDLLLSTFDSLKLNALSFHLMLVNMQDHEIVHTQLAQLAPRDVKAKSVKTLFRSYTDPYDCLAFCEFIENDVAWRCLLNLSIWGRKEKQKNKLAFYTHILEDHFQQVPYKLKNRLLFQSYNLAKKFGDAKLYELISVHYEHSYIPTTNLFECVFYSSIQSGRYQTGSNLLGDLWYKLTSCDYHGGAPVLPGDNSDHVVDEKKGPEQEGSSDERLWIPEKPLRVAIKLAHYSSLQNALLRTNMPGNISTAAQTLLDAPPLRLGLNERQSLPQLGVEQLYNTIILHAVAHKQFFQVLRLYDDMHSTGIRIDFMAMYGILLAVSDVPTYQAHYEGRRRGCMREVVQDIVRHKLRYSQPGYDEVKGAKECIGLVVDLLQLRDDDALRRRCDEAVTSNDWVEVMREMLHVVESDEADAGEGPLSV